MAMPVSMSLPDHFQPLDLGRLGKQSEQLVERYKKVDGTVGGAPAAPVVEATLARALESLAHSIEHLEERLTRQERRAEPGPANGYPGEPAPMLEPPRPDYPGENSYEEAPLPLEPGTEAGGPESVVQLQPEESKAQPVGAPVLVRREAARVAHHYRREHQKHWDDRGREERKVGFLQRMMEVAPKTTITITVVMVLVLVVSTILWMEYGTWGPKEKQSETLETTSMGQLWEDDLEAGQAEVVARGFLSATSAKVAKPFVYGSDRIERKFTELYQPIERPEDYKLILQSRAVAPSGASVFAYRVTMEDEQPRMLVVLPEGRMPKVFWEFFAEVGDYSWEEFMELQPSEPAMMRVWAYKGNRYVTPYEEAEWQCYVLHNYAENYVLHAYARRGEGADWNLSNALETRPVKYGRRNEVMAQVLMTFMSEVASTGDERLYIAEIKEVPVVSWLPSQFVPRKDD